MCCEAEVNKVFNVTTVQPNFNFEKTPECRITYYEIISTGRDNENLN